MGRSLRDYISSAGNTVAKWERLCNLCYSGFINSEELTEEVSNLETTGDSLPDNGELKIVAEFISGTCKLDNGNTAYIWNMSPSYEALQEVQPPWRSSVWFSKDYPDNCKAIEFLDGNSTISYTVGMMDQYGFVRIGDYMVSRTVQPVVLYSGKPPFQQPGCYLYTIPAAVVVMPYMNNEEFARTVDNDLVLGGGVSWKGFCKHRRATTFLKENYLCKANDVFVWETLPEEGPLWELL